MRRSGAAALVGASAGAVIGGSTEWLDDSYARWSSPKGGPDAEALLLVTLGGQADIADARLALVIQTPRGVIEHEVGPIRLTNGQTSVTVELRYPFDDIVEGRYEYRAVLRHAESPAATPLVTSQPVAYEVTPFLWFS